MLSKNQIKWVRSLELKKNRREKGVFVAEGPKVVGDLLRAGYKAHTIFCIREAEYATVDARLVAVTEEEVDAQEMFESHFMSDYLKGKHTPAKAQTCVEGELFTQGQNLNTSKVQKLQFSLEAQAVMDAGRELWRYYHKQPIAKERPNASFYDIRLYFQGTKTTKSGKQQMNTESSDSTYTSLITNLRQKQKELAKKIEPKVYEYGFLKK